MNNLEPVGSCWNCGRQCEVLFCNAKCEKSYQAKQRRKNGHWSGFSQQRNETNEFQGKIGG